MFILHCSYPKRSFVEYLKTINRAVTMYEVGFVRTRHNDETSSHSFTLDPSFAVQFTLRQAIEEKQQYSKEYDKIQILFLVE